MRKIFLFMMVTLDGYFEGKHQDISWHNADNEEFNAFAVEQLKTIGTILFGRKTYEGMASWWTAEQALKFDPVVAGLMNNAEKFAFSRSLDKVDWQNTTLIKNNAAGFVSQLKQKSGKDIAIFGSNNFCVSMMEAGLVDEFRIMVNPLAIGGGTALFQGIKHRVDFKRTATKEFDSGNVLLTYTKG